VEIFCGLLKEKKISERVLHSKRWVSIGEVTTKRLALFGVTSNLTSKVSTQEGLVDCLKELDMKGSYVLLPKSSLSRPVLSSYLKEERISHALVDLYDTVVNTSLTPIDLLEIDEIVFTSPSTVRAFFSYGMTVPENIHLTAIGPITQAALDAQSSPSLK
jgi:uroporphyrinogen-III synthase